MKKNEQNENNIEKKVDKVIKEQRFGHIVIIILIIILMLLIFFGIYLGYRMGKIGYQDVSSDSVKDSEEIPIITITENDINASKLHDLNIFANKKYNGEKLIAPGSYGTYKFCVRNESRGDIIYDINFSDYMTNPVNMKYKLKIDNVYIKGNANKYVGIDELNVEDIIVMEDSNNIYTIEWCWEDNDKADTHIGVQAQENYEYYQLRININSETIEGGNLN